MNCRTAIALLAAAAALHAEPVQLSGIYPSLASFNDEGECGTGAVVPWAGKLWVVTYAPHAPKGSSDKLYEITPDLQMSVRKESIGGTPANRMIHKESDQLFIGPYAISGEGQVRSIPYSAMFGRPTGNARHLTDAGGKIYYATMEEGIYEVDVKTLEVKELWRDEQLEGGRKANLPGYHGKGFYSGQGRLIYANNGDHAAEATSNPDIPSGVLAEWDGKASAWTIVRRNQFTEVTGPGGIEGNPSPEDPVWSIGWDYRSLILACLHQGQWHFWRLPKSSHSYDGSHGWNTEWPRIRDIGEKDYLMTMHGTFWNFPKDFTPGHSAGITPRSNYLKVIGDFCRWNDRLVFGCDDTAKSEFINKRKAKGSIAAPQSQSNLWFTTPEQLDQLGPLIGRGAVWGKERVEANKPSDSYLFSGYDRKGLHLARSSAAQAATIAVEVDEAGDGTWKKAREIRLEGLYQWTDLSDLKGAWVRLVPDTDLEGTTALFQYSNEDRRSEAADEIFSGLASATGTEVRGGLVRALSGNKRTLGLLRRDGGEAPSAAYVLDSDLKLVKSTDKSLAAALQESTAIPKAVLARDEASLIYTDDKGKRWRLPLGSAAAKSPLGDLRVCREVATERDLFHAGGTFYELPAENAGGFAKARAIATSNHLVHDFCSYRGLFIMTGIAAGEGSGNPHIIRSEDGEAALWAGAIDDLWKIGKPRGKGGPWKNTMVKAGQTSDPYLMTGFDKKSLRLSSDRPATITAEVDITGAGQWVAYRSFKLDGSASYEFPAAFQAYWIRFTCDTDAIAEAQLTYW